MCGSVITIPRNDNLLNETIHVETKGELGNVLADYDYARIGSLKIVWCTSTTMPIDLWQRNGTIIYVQG